VTAHFPPPLGRAHPEHSASIDLFTKMRLKDIGR
jgi:hypothetical protein